MKRLAFVGISAMLAATALSAPPVTPIRLDIQTPQATFQARVASGSTPTFRAFLLDDGANWPDASSVTGGAFYFYGTNWPATNWVSIPFSGAGSNYVNFAATSSKTATSGVFQAHVVVVTTNQTLVWGSGRLTLDYVPPLLYGGTPLDLALGGIELDPKALPGVLAVSGRVDAITSDIGILSGRVDNVILSVGTVSSRVDGAAAGILSVSGRVDTVTSGIGVVSGRVDALSASIGSVSGRVDFLDPHVAGLTYSGTNVTTDAAAGSCFSVTLTNNAMLALPSGMRAGQVLRWFVTQGVGSNALDASQDFRYPAGITNLAVSTAAGATDLIVAEATATNRAFFTGLLKYNP